MPLIQVKQTPGKTAEQKAALVRELTDAYVRATGGKPESLWVTVEEVATDSWAVGGETLAARAAAAQG
ncbi:4-oxalocrotonate tautomerase family protein [Streptomyces luteireticuli]